MSPTPPSPRDCAALRRDKYHDQPGVQETAAFADDVARLAAGEPLAYVIGWIPFLGLRIELDSRPLIPRPETEWWTEQLIAHLRQKFGSHPFTFLDLCAGSGCIGLAILQAFPQASVSFAELIPEHIALIERNIAANSLDRGRAHLYTGDLFAALTPQAAQSSTEAEEAQKAPLQFDAIATNPPYIPEGRELDASVTNFEPAEALFGGEDGLTLIQKIITTAPAYLAPGGELWIECDSANAAAAHACAEAGGFGATIRTDQYGRPRLVVAYLL